MTRSRLTRAQAAEALGVSVRTLRRRIAEGHLTAREEYRLALAVLAVAGGAGNRAPQGDLTDATDRAGGDNLPR